MRRTLRLLTLVFALLVGVTSPAVAEELPPGFIDGRPVGGGEAQPSAERASDTAEVAAATQRHFGAGAYDAVRDAVAATSRSCVISDDGLTAMVLAPVFKESSAATTPSTAPSPMTLSRYDEWNGVLSDTMGTPENNYGLYAFRNPSTPYKRVFWSPGIGIWQYDSAGLGAPLTTVEAMNVGTVAADVARVMAANYCNPSSTLVGHGPPFTDQERRYSAWRDWGYPCTLCQEFFQEMVGTTPRFQNLVLVPGISVLGVKARSCSLQGSSAPLPCWYVKPVVGVVQGATAWATLTPLDGGSTTETPTPISLPFYVVDRGTTEERHWLRADTGYGIDIVASRTIGKNARPTSAQAGSGLTWSNSSSLCDITTGKGICGPIPPPGVSSQVFAINGSHQPIQLDANGDGRADVVWYAPGSTPDALWIGTGPTTFATSTLNITKSYAPTVLDADGDGDEDLLWYDLSNGSVVLWRYSGSGFTGTIIGLPGVTRRVALPVNIDADAAEEVFWYGAGTTPDAVWNWTGSTYSTSARTVNRTYEIHTGDFDGNNRDDILFYAPGGAADSIWFHGVAGNVTAAPQTITGDYEVRIGRFDGDLRDDLLFYRAGTAGDSAWFGGAGGAFTKHAYNVNASYAPFPVDVLGTGRDQMIWYAPGAAADAMWSWNPDRSVSSQPLVLPHTQQPVVGPFSAGGGDGILWYGPGSQSDVLWYR